MPDAARSAAAKKAWETIRKNRAAAGLGAVAKAKKAAAAPASAPATPSVIAPVSPAAPPPPPPPHPTTTHPTGPVAAPGSSSTPAPVSPARARALKAWETMRKKKAAALLGQSPPPPVTATTPSKPTVAPRVKGVRYNPKEAHAAAKDAYAEALHSGANEDDAFEAARSAAADMGADEEDALNHAGDVIDEHEAQAALPQDAKELGEFISKAARAAGDEYDATHPNDYSGRYAVERDARIAATRSIPVDHIHNLMRQSYRENERARVNYETAERNRAEAERLAKEAARHGPEFVAEITDEARAKIAAKRGVDPGQVPSWDQEVTRIVRAERQARQDDYDKDPRVATAEENSRTAGKEFQEASQAAYAMKRLGKDYGIRLSDAKKSKSDEKPLKPLASRKDFDESIGLAPSTGHSLNYREAAWADKVKTWADQRVMRAPTNEEREAEKDAEYEAIAKIREAAVRDRDDEMIPMIPR